MRSICNRVHSGPLQALMRRMMKPVTMARTAGWAFVLGWVLSLGACQQSFTQNPPETHSKPNEVKLETRIQSRDFPSVFQAWYGIDMPDYPQDQLEQRLTAAAKHDLLWEEPLSQLGEGKPLVLGLVWEGDYQGLASGFTAESLQQALANRKRLLELNPNMTFLFEIRWRDAPRSFLPEDSPFWKKDENGEVIKGWLGGWEPFYMLNYDHPAFIENVARQAEIALQSGVYDGVMLDWSGHLPIIQKVRAAIGKEGLIIVNIHDDIADGERYKDYINGAFMELNPEDYSTLSASGSDRNLRNWGTIREALLWFEDNFQSPVINCLEVWGDRKDLARMRATTTLALTHSNAYVLYGDPNPLPTPDHLHDWYAFWDVPLGTPQGSMQQLENGAFLREFEGGTVVYNHYGNGPVNITFDQGKKRISTGETGKRFSIADRDGDIFLDTPN